MHQGRRRLSLILGMSVLALAVAFPASAAARSIPAGVAGAHVWTGQTCSGKAISVSYHVTSRGRAVFDSASGGRARVGWAWHGFRVRFAGTSSRVLVWTNWRHGTLRLHVSSSAGHCSNPPAGDPPSGDPPSGDPGNDSPPG